MWVNIDMTLSFDEIIEYLKKLDYLGPIYISFNTLCKGTKVLEIIPKLLIKFKDNNLNVYEGPHFVEEGCIINSEIKIFDELYFSTQGEKIIWYIKHFSLPEDINSIILMSSNLGIEPIIINMKDKDKKYQYYFVQKEPLADDINALLINSNCCLQRIKE